MLRMLLAKIHHHQSVETESLD